MDIDVWQTAIGRDLTKDLIPLKVDTQSPEGQAIMDRYPILGLPTSLFLLPDGTELDRVEGYFSRDAYLSEARNLAAGVDPLPGMEARLQTRPDSLDLVLDVLERYLHRRRDADAESLYVRVLRDDPRNARTYAERAIRDMARYAEYGRHQPGQAADYWATMVDRFPMSTSVGAAVEGAYEGWSTAGQADRWLPWICSALKKYPNVAYLQRAAAMTGYRGGFRDPCLAEAARTARRLGQVPAALLDSIAVIMDKPR